MGQMLTADYWIGVSGNLVASAILAAVAGVGVWFGKFRKELRALHDHIEATRPERKLDGTQPR